uniref:G-protein coupled receptors family 1 profile domain-containing protein n=1 Tax=Clytia hemisphaerica TaxID=252671 RepID=A0A7M5XAS0_9CNID
MAHVRWDCYTAIIIVILNLFVIFMIQKAKLHSHRFYLIQLLSLIDALQPAIIIFIIIFREELKHQKTVYELLSIFFYLFGIMSNLQIVFITGDRFLEMRYCLKYYRLVTRRRILLLTALTFAVCGVLVITVSKWTRHFNDYFLNTTFGVLCLDVVVRTLTILFALLVGFAVKRIRKRNIAQLRNRTIYDGFQQERMLKLIELKMSIKDVTILNIWTVIFLTPQIITGIIMIVFNDQLRIYDAIFRIIYLVSNPFVYLATQTKLRKAVKTLFGTHNRINPLNPAD